MNKRIKGYDWDPDEFHVGTKVKVNANFNEYIEDFDGHGPHITIGCNTIPVKVIKAAGGKVDKKTSTATAPMVLYSRGILRIPGGRGAWGNTSWNEDYIRDYAKTITVVEAPDSPPEEITRWLQAGLWSCTADWHRHAFMLGVNGEWTTIQTSSEGTVVYPDSPPDFDCHPILGSRLEMITGVPVQTLVVGTKAEAAVNGYGALVEATVFASATCCMYDMVRYRQRPRTVFERPVAT